MQIADLYVVEWNMSLNQFHVQTASEMLDANHDVFLSRRDSSESDWLVLAIEPSYEKAHKALQSLKAKLDQPDTFA